MSGKGPCRKRSQSQGEQRCVRAKKLCFGGNAEVAQKSKIWISRRESCVRLLMCLYPSRSPQGVEPGLHLPGMAAARQREKDLCYHLLCRRGVTLPADTGRVAPQE